MASLIHVLHGARQSVGGFINIFFRFSLLLRGDSAGRFETVMMDSMTLLIIGSKLIGLSLRGSVFAPFFMWCSDVGGFPSRWKMTSDK